MSIANKWATNISEAALAEAAQAKPLSPVLSICAQIFSSCSHFFLLSVTWLRSSDLLERKQVRHSAREGKRGMESVRERAIEIEIKREKER